MTEGICKKCKGECFPFDVYCDDCDVVNIYVNGENKQNLVDAVNELGYQFYEQKDYHTIVIHAPRKDHGALRNILREINEQTLKHHPESLVIGNLTNEHGQDAIKAIKRQLGKPDRADEMIDSMLVYSASEVDTAFQSLMNMQAEVS